MVRFSENLVKELSVKHLLKHPFYQRWTCGELSLDDLALYARQYFHHVNAFPRYISATHSLCQDIQSRQVLLANLVEEEQGEKNHPELWMQFAQGMGASRQDVLKTEYFPETEELVDTFMDLSRNSYAEGIGALFAYEHQIPEVAAAKIDGLKRFYGVDAPEVLEFFETHLKADVWHSQETAQLMDQLSPQDQETAKQAAKRAAEALWRFLDGVDRETRKS